MDAAVGRSRSPAGAAAVPLLTEELADVSGMNLAASPPVGDASATLSGPAVSGCQQTAFVAYGPYLIVATAVATAGDRSPSVAALVSTVVEALAA